MKDDPDKSVEIKMPVCHYCKAKMRAIHFEGYYDSFDFWKCDCETIPDKNKSGDYGENVGGF